MGAGLQATGWDQLEPQSPYEREAEVRDLSRRRFENGRRYASYECDDDGYLHGLSS